MIVQIIIIIKGGNAGEKFTVRMRKAEGSKFGFSTVANYLSQWHHITAWTDHYNACYWHVCISTTHTTDTFIWHSTVRQAGWLQGPNDQSQSTTKERAEAHHTLAEPRKIYQMVSYFLQRNKTSYPTLFSHSYFYSKAPAQLFQWFSLSFGFNEPASHH